MLEIVIFGLVPVELRIDKVPHAAASASASLHALHEIRGKKFFFLGLMFVTHCGYHSALFNIFLLLYQLLHRPNPSITFLT